MPNPMLPSGPTAIIGAIPPGHRSRRTLIGFTLVELLVVLAIVALLIAMLLPALGRSREHARRILCGNNARTIAAATLMYSDDFKGYVPDNAQRGAYGRYTIATENRRALYLDYGANRWESWFCPSGISRGYHTYIPRVARVNPYNWFAERENVPGLPHWTENNRALTGYGYWTGTARGYTPGSGNAIKYSYGRVMRVVESDAPSRRIVWGEAIKPNGSTNAGWGGWSAPANGHTRDGSTECEGGWFAMLDNSVVWRRVEFGVNTLDNVPFGQHFAYKD